MNALQSSAAARFTMPRRVLMGPGPSDVHPRVLAAMAEPTIGHLDPLFVELMDKIKAQLKFAFRTANEFTMPVSGPGSVGMETCFFNVVEPGDTVIVCQNGVFGGRMKEVASRAGAKVVLVQDAWGRAVDPDKLREALKANPGAKAVGFVHAETSTGALSDAATLAAIAREHGALSIVDAVTSLGGVPLEVDAWGLDAVYSGTQKCLSAPPGLSPVTLSPRALEAAKNRRTPVQSWFMDANLVTAYWSGGGKRAYHHTAPVNALYGLHEALRLLEEEGLENAWARHRRVHEQLVAGLEGLAACRTLGVESEKRPRRGQFLTISPGNSRTIAQESGEKWTGGGDLQPTIPKSDRLLGMEMLVPAAERLPQLNAVKIPAAVSDEAALRTRLLNEFNLEIGAGLGVFAGKVWRIGLMGQSASEAHVRLCLDALKAVLPG